MIIIRFLIYFLILYVVYRIIRAWVGQSTSRTKPIFGKPAGEIEDIMIKDPYCNIYFPKREGVRLRKNGTDLYFCSTDCRDNYLKEKGKERV